MIMLNKKIFIVIVIVIVIVNCEAIALKVLSCKIVNIIS